MLLSCSLDLAVIPVAFTKVLSPKVLAYFVERSESSIYKDLTISSSVGRIESNFLASLKASSTSVKGATPVIPTSLINNSGVALGLSSKYPGNFKSA